MRSRRRLDYSIIPGKARGSGDSVRTVGPPKRDGLFDSSPALIENVTADDQGRGRRQFQGTEWLARHFVSPGVSGPGDNLRPQHEYLKKLLRQVLSVLRRTRSERKVRCPD